MSKKTYKVEKAPQPAIIIKNVNSDIEYYRNEWEDFYYGKCDS